MIDQLIELLTRPWRGAFCPEVIQDEEWDGPHALKALVVRDGALGASGWPNGTASLIQPAPAQLLHMVWLTVVFSRGDDSIPDLGVSMGRSRAGWMRVRPPS